MRASRPGPRSAAGRLGRTHPSTSNQYCRRLMHANHGGLIPADLSLFSQGAVQPVSDRKNVFGVRRLCLFHSGVGLQVAIHKPFRESDCRRVGDNGHSTLKVARIESCVGLYISFKLQMDWVFDFQ